MTPATPAHKLNGSKRRNVGLLSAPVKKSPCVNQTRMLRRETKQTAQARETTNILQLKEFFTKAFHKTAVRV